MRLGKDGHKLATNQTDSRTFEEAIKYGSEAEEEVFSLLNGLGFSLIPKYRYSEQGKGPKTPSLFTPDRRIVTPDIEAFAPMRAWIEVKRKALMAKYPRTGFARRLFRDYKEVQRVTGAPVFVVFRDEKRKEFYGNWLDDLEGHAQSDVDVTGCRANTEPLVLFSYPEAFKVTTFEKKAEIAKWLRSREA